MLAALAPEVTTPPAAHHQTVPAKAITQSAGRRGRGEERVRGREAEGREHGRMHHELKVATKAVEVVVEHDGLHS